MNVDSKKDLRLWTAKIEEALAVAISVNEDGGFAVCTKGGATVGIEAAPNLRAAILTGQFGTVSETTSLRTLRALLALNMAAGLSGTGIIGLAPENDALLSRLIWTPHESAWTQDDFISILAAFSEHVDALSISLDNGALETILGPPRDDSSAIDVAQLA